MTHDDARRRVRIIDIRRMYRRSVKKWGVVYLLLTVRSILCFMFIVFHMNLLFC